jgi:hypothetical protein
MRYNGFSAIPDPKPEWPYPGGLSAQPAKLVAAFDALRMEMPNVLAKSEKPAATLVDAPESHRHEGDE